MFAYSVWVGISVVWVSTAAFFIIFLPLIEARHGIAKVLGKKATTKSSSGGK